MHTLKELVTTGKQLFENKEYKKSEYYLKKALELNDNYADVLNMVGVLHHIDGKFSSAIDYFRRALKINPSYTEAMLNLAVLFNDLGRYQEAKGIYVRLQSGTKAKQKEIEPVLKGKLSNLHSDIGDIYRSVGLYQSSIEEYIKALNLNKDYIDIRVKLGIAYRENGQPEDSIRELKTVSKANPNYAHAKIQLGVSYYTTGNIKSAQEEWKKALDKEPTNEHAKMYLRLCKDIKVIVPKKATAPKKVAGKKR
jgi:tetratricopeptide (TPR) repeat protein